MQIYTSSTSCNRVPHGQNIPGSVLVPVVRGPAVARPLPDGQWHGRLQGSARRTHLAAREPAVDLDHGLAVHRRFRFDSPDRVSDTGIAQAAGKAVVFYHAAQVEVFDANRVVSGDDAPRQFLRRVAARVGDLFMHTRHALALTLVSIRALHLAGKGLLLAFQLPLVAVRVLRVRNTFAGGQGGQPGNAEVDADILSSCRQWRRRDINDQRHEVAATRLANNCHSGRIDWDMLGPFHLERPNLRQEQPLIADFELERGTGVFGGLFAILALERRVAGAFVEEVFERCLQVAKCLLGRNAGDFIQPYEVGIAFERRERSARLIVVHALAALKSCGALSEKPIVDEPRAPERLGKMLLLLWRRVAAECPSLFHAYNYAIFLVNQQHKERAFLPGLNAGVSSAKI